MIHSKTVMGMIRKIAGADYITRDNQTRIIPVSWIQEDNQMKDPILPVTPSRRKEKKRSRSR